MLMALYMHLGPFSKNVIGEIDRRIAQLDEANRGSAAEVVYGRVLRFDSLVG
jgi:hypothetical protein